MTTQFNSSTIRRPVCKTLGILTWVGLTSLGMTGFSLIFGLTPSIASSDIPPAGPEFIRPAFICPSDVDSLIPLLLRDLPSYANRVSTRAQVRDRSFNPRGVVVAAAQPAVASLDVDIYAMMPSEEAIAANGLIPLFFTTLERHYLNGTTTRIQHYHWAFLSHTPQNQWGLAILFSRIGDYPANQPASPPRESRQGTIGQGLHLWLRDCNAGAIDP